MGESSGRPVVEGNAGESSCDARLAPRGGTHPAPRRPAAPHFVTWGDGSTDEMCIGLAWTARGLPDGHSVV